MHRGELRARERRKRPADHAFVANLQRLHPTVEPVQKAPKPRQSAEALAELRGWLDGAPQDEQDVKRRLALIVPEYRPQGRDRQA